jgi:AcrR family transcriptional regulator
MPYRRTERVVRKLNARHNAIMAAARDLAAEVGMGGVQIVRVAGRAGIAAGTVYRYFPAKVDLIAALAAAQSEAEIAAIERAARTAPGPLSALAAGIVIFADRAARNPRLAFALMAEPVDAELEPVRARFREAIAGAFARCIRRAIDGQHLADQDPALAAAALVGGLVEALVGRLGAPPSDDPAERRALVQTLALFMLRGLGIVDARARGLVVQIALPPGDGAELEGTV